MTTTPNPSRPAPEKSAPEKSAPEKSAPEHVDIDLSEFDREERYVIWRNPGPRMIEPTIHNVRVPLWMAGITKSLPESWTPEAKALGLERVGFAS